VRSRVGVLIWFVLILVGLQPVVHAEPLTRSAAGGASSSASLVSNGGFEYGNYAWSGYSNNGRVVIDSTRPHSGSAGAHLCGYVGCSASVAQTVTLPYGSSASSLTFWTYVSTQEPAYASCTDALSVNLRTTTGITISSVVKVCNSSQVNAWVLHSVNISTLVAAYSGQQVQLSFRGFNDAQRPTTFWVDDVLWTSSSTPPSATPTLTPTPMARCWAEQSSVD